MLLVTALVAGCSLPPAQPGTNATTSTPPATTTPTPATHAAFSGPDALAFAREQVLYKNGTTRYRVPGTDGNDEAAALIAEHLGADHWNVTYDVWPSPFMCGNVTLHNVVAERTGTSGRIVLIGAHYDTRPVGDSDPDPANRTLPIPGANDGASGVGVLLELAHVLARTNDTVRLLFFDAEDAGSITVVPSCGTDWLLGSTHYANHTLPLSEWSKVKAMVLADLVGDPNLTFPKELSSEYGPGKLVQQRIYEVAGGLGYAGIFTNDSKDSADIEDDHTPFLQRSMPGVDLIHLVHAPQYFPEWHHTLHDDMSHVSAASLEAVGKTLQVWLESGQLSDAP